MSYSNNPLLPKARRQAVNLVLKEGFRVAVAARRCGIHRSTLHRWLRKVNECTPSPHITTLSSRAKSYPRALSEEVVGRIHRVRETDNGSEFASAFGKFLNQSGVSQRRIRLGKKNDNALTWAWTGKHRLDIKALMGAFRAAMYRFFLDILLRGDNIRTLCKLKQLIKNKYSI